MPYQNPYPMTYQNPYQYVPEPQVNNTFAWIQGVESAKAFQVPRGATAVLIDQDNSKMYIKETDENGRPKKMVSYTLSQDKEEGEREITPEFLEERLRKMKYEILESVKRKDGKNEQRN